MCSICFTTHETGSLLKHIRREIKSKKITDHDHHYYSTLSSEMVSFGVRAITEDEVLEEFPDADVNFMEKLDRLLRKKAVIIVDGTELVPDVIPNSAQPSSSKDSQDDAGVQEAPKKIAAEYYSLLQLPDVKNSRIDDLFKKHLCPEDVSVSDAEKNLRNYKQFSLNTPPSWLGAQEKNEFG